jgi:hypothetical protein
VLPLLCVQILSDLLTSDEQEDAEKVIGSLVDIAQQCEAAFMKPYLANYVTAMTHIGQALQLEEGCVDRKLLLLLLLLLLLIMMMTMLLSFKSNRIMFQQLGRCQLFVLGWLVELLIILVVCVYVCVRSCVCICVCAFITFFCSTNC